MIDNDIRLFGNTRRHSILLITHEYSIESTNLCEYKDFLNTEPVHFVLLFQNTDASEAAG